VIPFFVGDGVGMDWWVGWLEGRGLRVSCPLMVVWMYELKKESFH
jgi:hypothetical protein